MAGRHPSTIFQLYSRSHALTFSHCVRCSFLFFPHLTAWVFQEPVAGLTRRTSAGGEKYTVQLPYLMRGFLPIPGYSGIGPSFFGGCAFTLSLPFSLPLSLPLSFATFPLTLTLCAGVLAFLGVVVYFVGSNGGL